MNQVKNGLNLGLLIITFLLPVVGMAQSDFKPGHYYTKDRQKVVGLIKHNVKAGGKGALNSIEVKSHSKGEKQELTIKDISGFVVLNDQKKLDTFGIIQRLKLDRSITWMSTKFIAEDFAQVLDTGQVSLYKYFFRFYSRGTPSLGMFSSGIPSANPVGGFYANSVSGIYYLVHKDTNLPVVVNPDSFRKDMKEYFKDYEPLAKAIEKERFTYENIGFIVSQYNEWYRKKNNAL